VPTRGQRLYDRWSDREWAFDLLYGLVFLGRESRFRRRTITALDLSPGDHVLELGCGPGDSLAVLREAVGPRGRVVAVDYSAGMAARAVDRASAWENVHVVRADATRLGLATDAFDAAFASMSLTATADPTAAVREAARCLRSDGRLAVLDARPFPSVPWVLGNPVVVPTAEWVTNWTPVDVVEAIDGAFDAVSVETATGGAVVVVGADGPRDADRTATDGSQS